MRVLILPAILALAVAAPSGDLKVAAPLAVLPVITPTIDPGDIQAAAINAQVAAEDQARAVSDKIVEEHNEKAIELDSLVKEKTEETIWAGEDKKWQALDAVHTAAAKIDGSVASNADALARSALGGVVLPNYVAPSLLPTPLVRTPIVPGTPVQGISIYGTPIISPINPLVYNPGLIATKEEENKEKVVKTAEPEKDKQVQSLHTLYPGLVSTPVLSPISPYAFVPVIKKENEAEKQILKQAELEKDKQQVLQNVYGAQTLPLTSYLFYNTNVFAKPEESGKEKEKNIAKTAEPETYNQQVFYYPARFVTAPIISQVSPIVYTPSILAKKAEVPKDSEIEKNTELKKEQNKLEDKKDEKIKADKDKLEKPVVAPIFPLVGPQWPLSPVAPVYLRQPVLTPVINTQW